MGKYKDHRERRGKRHSSDQGSEPSYFQDAPSAFPVPVDAEVVWFNTDKGFGFVKLPDGSEAYLHIRVLEAAGANDLSDGVHLKITVEEGSRGRQVATVINIDSQSSTTPADERRSRNTTAESNSELESEGTVKWYNAEKGFGFIAPENGENDVFVHATALTRSGLTVLKEGQKVIFQSAQGKKGMEVRTVRPA